MLINFLKKRLKQMTLEEIVKDIFKKMFPREKRTGSDNSKTSAYSKQKVM